MFKRSTEQPTDPGKRICTRCHVEKSVGDFYQAKPSEQNFKTYNGVRMPCPECCRALSRARSKRADVAEKRRAYAKYRYMTDVEFVERKHKRNKAWYEANRERELERQKRRHASLTEDERNALKARLSAYYEAHKDSFRESSRKRRSTPEGRAAHNAANANRKATEAGREQARLQSQARRARQHRAGGRLTPLDWRSVQRAYGGRCAYCGIDGKMTIDHVVPVAKGGRHDVTNVVPACTPCNLKKNALELNRALAKLNLSRLDFEKRRCLAMLMARGIVA